MGKTSDVGVLLTGVVLGAAAIYFSDEKNRDKAQKKFDDLSGEVKQLGKQWQDDPDKAIASLKKKAATLTQEIEKSGKETGKKLSAASKAKMVEALAETEKMIGNARKSLAADSK